MMLEGLKIKSKLNIGNDICVYGNSCKFTVTTMFDKYNLNTKYFYYVLKKLLSYIKIEIN